ncbi:hypothetical protein GUITHDRAFT_135335 [Guillardia theta CCMP2712]|uniref:Uncharacterized protein n=1 Tax=Guillardia theta (strain CCMP2712) TaxID=905079 RepID=L1JNW6_GUITC|nr:hypothetical protein GUITHDRAFT_135335 [Guillardia theta CCMP2712]EKX50152.1 hypothetical protein GUITHDRAFT_135335 [Guillardia theta CCMP2712]|eukprot:XP_005837132.1 hypothetical protein GUITHDRAFT_135335 [Guillardia theta CCMP2712]
MAVARKAAFATAALGLVCVILLPRGSSIELLTGRGQNGLASSFVNKVYQEDEKAGRRFLQENKDKLHAAGLDDILRDPSMKEYLSVALGSKKFQLNVPNQELKLQGSNSAAAKPADARAPHHAVQQVHARVGQQSKGGKPAASSPRLSRTSTAPSFYAAPVQSNGLNVVYDQFAPGILHGTQRHHVKAVNKARQPVARATAKGNPLSAADDSHLFDDNFQESTSKVGKLSQQIEELKREIKEEREKNKELNMKVHSPGPAQHDQGRQAERQEQPAEASKQPPAKQDNRKDNADAKKSMYDKMLSDEMEKASRLEKENEFHANFILNGGHYVMDKSRQKNMLAATHHRSGKRSEDWRKLARISKELAKKEMELQKAKQVSRDLAAESRQTRYVSKARDTTAPFLCGLPLLSELSSANCRSVDHVQIESHQNSILEGLKRLGLGDDEIRMPSGQVRGGAAGIPKRRFGKLWTPTHPYDKQTAVEALGFSDPQQYERHALLNTIAKEEDTIHALKAELDRRTGGVAHHSHARESRELPVYHQLSDSYSSVGRGHSKKQSNLAMEVMREALKSDLSRVGDRQVPMSEGNHNIDLELLMQEQARYFPDGLSV